IVGGDEQTRCGARPQPASGELDGSDIALSTRDRVLDPRGPWWFGDAEPRAGADLSAPPARRNRRHAVPAVATAGVDLANVAASAGGVGAAAVRREREVADLGAAHLDPLLVELEGAEAVVGLAERVVRREHEVIVIVRVHGDRVTSTAETHRPARQVAGRTAR